MNAESERTDFHVTNALGTTLATFDSLDLARIWVRRHLWRFPSLRVERVTFSVTRKTVYRPANRSAERAVA